MGGVLIGGIKNNPIIVLISVVVGMILLYSIQRKYKVILADERIQMIWLKSGDATFRVFAFVFGSLFLTIHDMTQDDLAKKVKSNAKSIQRCRTMLRLEQSNLPATRLALRPYQ